MSGNRDMASKSSMKKEERGSALLASLMVMVGLSLLGLGFVALSETESAISANERNYAQTRQLAEAAAREVVEWFQDPDWNRTQGLMPAVAKRANFMVDRMVNTGSGITNIGKWKYTDTTNFCCDKPYKPAQADRLYGTADNPDVWIHRFDGDTLNVEGAAFLDAFNARLFTNLDQGQITEIRIYAPPIIGATPNVNNFYNHNDGTRYGLASVMVVAQKRTRYDRGNNSDLIASKSVKLVISEWPFPGPQGPVQSNANIQTGGSIVVHWGKMTSQRDMFVKRPLVGLPWMDATEQVLFEHGYWSSNMWSTTGQYYAGDKIYPTAGGDYDFKVISPAGATPAGGTEPNWALCAAVGTTCVDSAGITWQKIWRMPFRNQTAGLYDKNYNWMYEIIGYQYQDPWVQARARGAITNAVIASSGKTGVWHPFPYTVANMATPTVDPSPGFSNWFQLQTTTDVAFPIQRKEVIFPRIDYQFWKDTAIAGQGQDGVYYLQWDHDDVFRNSSGVQKTFKNWTNIATGAKRGFYFFDTKNGQNPQVAGGDTFLTPAVDVSSGGGSTWTMSGFVYLNAASFGTTGIRGIAGRFNFPGEPFRDVGLPFVDPSGNFSTDTTNPNFSSETGYVMARDSNNNSYKSNGHWDYLDVNGNNRFDLYMENQTVTRPDGSRVTMWLPVEYFPGCTITNSDTSNAFVANGCSEPHEPYLNLVYPSDACCTGASEPNPIYVGWEAPASQTRRVKSLMDSGALPTLDAQDRCTDSAQWGILEDRYGKGAGNSKYCTSNGYDYYGYYDLWDSNQDSPVLDGVFYNQGTMSSQGNARFFGSVLINGDIDNTGTNEVWFDERLIKEEWPPKSWPFPRVIITALQSD